MFPKDRYLGRLFFILVRPLKQEGRATLFADDTTLVTWARHLDQLNIQARVLLGTAKKWFASNKLKTK